MKTIFFGLIALMVISCTKEDNEINIIVSVDDFSVVMDENPLKNQIIGSLNASTNKGDLKYSVISQIPNGAFKIDSISGEITVNDPKLFDFESFPSIKGNVRVTNEDVYEETNVTITLNNFSLDSIVAGDTISPYINIVKVNFFREYPHYYDFDINNDGIDDIQFIFDNQFLINRHRYLGVILLHENIEMARSLDMKNYVISQLPLYDPEIYEGSYAYNANEVEWTDSFVLNQTIDNNFDWINDTFYFETHSHRGNDGINVFYMEFYSIQNDEYIGLRIKTDTGFLYGWLSYPELWFWGKDYTIIAMNTE